jgi:hypothetical protein
MSKEPLALTVKDKPGEVVAWACGECRYVAVNEQAARKCCAEVVCSVCGRKNEEKRTYKIYSWTCSDCRNKAFAKKRWDARQKAEQVKYEDYEGPVYWEDFEKFEDSMCAMFDQIIYEYEDHPEEETSPEHFMEWIAKQTFWCCDEIHLGIPCAGDIIDNLVEDHHEDAEMSDLAIEGLQKRLDDWHQTYGDEVTSWESNGKRLVVSDKVWLEMAAEYDKEDE